MLIELDPRDADLVQIALLVTARIVLALQEGREPLPDDPVRHLDPLDVERLRYLAGALEAGELEHHPITRR